MPASRDLMLFAGDMEPLCASSQLLRFIYYMKVNCNRHPTHSQPTPRCRALTLPHVHIGSLCYASHCLTLQLYLLFGSHIGLVSRFAVLVVSCSHTYHQLTHYPDRYLTDTRFVSHCRTLAHDIDRDSHAIMIYMTGGAFCRMQNHTSSLTWQERQFDACRDALKVSSEYYSR